MQMARVADYSAGKPGAAALKRAGFVGAVRYIGQPGWTKNTSAAELQDFNEHGLGMALVFELSAGDWRGGFEAGVRNARAARDHADAIEFPPDRPIYMAVDQDVVSEAEFRQVDAYLDGAASVLHKLRTGPYGEFEVCRRSAERGYVWQWQCRAWSGTPPQMFDGRRLFQYYGHPESGPGGTPGPNITVGGVEVDTNEVNHPDWGQHTAEGLNMTEAQMQKLANMIADAVNVRVLWGPRYGDGERNLVDAAIERTNRLIMLSDKAPAENAQLVEALSLTNERLGQVVNLLVVQQEGHQG